MLDPQVTFPCSVNSVPFYPAMSMRRVVDAVPNFGQAAYAKSLLPFQTYLPYTCKALFTDILTIQFKTQVNSTIVNPATPATRPQTYTNPATLRVFSSVTNSKGISVPYKEITAFTTPFATGAEFWGIQAAPFDVYEDPITKFAQQLASYNWLFSFGDYLDPATDSGIYFLRFDNADQAGSVVTWYSEPIMVYGVDAAVTMSSTLLIQGNNTTNRSDILMTGWFYSGGVTPVFRTRVEGDILGYEPKGVYAGFIVQDFTQNISFQQSWKTFVLTVGSNTNGIPATFFEIVSKFLELDLVAINSQYYTYDMGDSGDSGPKAVWKMKITRSNGLCRGSLPVRYKFANQFYAPPFGGSRFHETEFEIEFD
jgi:hypothetical protein